MAVEIVTFPRMLTNHRGRRMSLKLRNGLRLDSLPSFVVLGHS